jgi:hypothetical protein
MVKLAIVATVSYIVERKPFAKPQTFTDIAIKAGDEFVAGRRIPGRWTAAQALTEFKRFPTRFKAMNIAYSLTDLARAA